MKKKILSVVLVVVIALTAVPFTVGANDMTVEGILGSGAATDPYIIKSAAQLIGIAQNRYPNSLSSHYRMANDITITTIGWNAIGSSDSNNFRFIGTFDGNGYKISGLVARNTTAVAYYGLFGVIGNGGVVRNLGIENAVVENVGFNGSSYNGILVGVNNGTIENCYTSGLIVATFDVGGLAGYSNGQIRNSYSIANVRTTGECCTGGLVGCNNSGTVTRSYAAGNVSGGSTASGGLVGRNHNGTTAIIASFYDNATSGQVDTGKGVSTFTANMKRRETFTALDVNWDFDTVWSIDPTVNRGYPFLRVMNTYVPDKTFAIVAASCEKGGGSVEGSRVYYEGDEATLLAIAEVGYIFEGWYENNVRVATTPTLRFTAAAARTLEARFVENRRTITLNANGGKVVNPNVTVIPNVAVGDLPVPTRAGHTFLYWADQNGNMVDKNSTFTVDTMLQAVWQKDHVWYCSFCGKDNLSCYCGIECKGVGACCCCDEHAKTIGVCECICDRVLNGDVDRDGKITTADALEILKHIVGISSKAGQRNDAAPLPPR